MAAHPVVVRTMAREALNCSDVPPAIGPYSHAVRHDGLLYVSGQIPVDAVTGDVIDGDVAAQTEQVLRNLSVLLEGLGSHLNHVLKVTVFLTDMSTFGAMNDVYARYFTEAPPARAAVGVAALPKGVDVEIECIAAMPE